MANLKDFATGTVLIAPLPADSGTSFTLQSGEGAIMPSVPFYATAHPDNVLPLISNSEKILVTAISTDTLTIVRAQGVGTAKDIEIGWRISNTIFADDIPDTFDDLTDGTTNKAFTATLKSKLDDAVVKSDTSTTGMGFVIDEDNMVSDSSTKLPTQQSTKAYVDSLTSPLLSGGVLGDIQYYTTSGANTWTKPAGLKYIIVECVGGGGGGGGAGTTSSSNFSCGKGGGGGAYSRKKILAASLSSTETATVGAGGNGGSAGANNGSTGGASSFGTSAFLTANGGALGNGGGSAAIDIGSLFNQQASQTPATASGGDLNVPGGTSLWNFSGSAALGFGPGKSGGTLNNGAAGTVYGAGGTGGVNRDGGVGTARSGGAGASGIVIVYEYY